MDYARHFRREVTAFEAAARAAVGADAAPPVPSCPGWTMSDLVVHLGKVHRGVAFVIEYGITQPVDVSEGTATLPGDRAGWPTDDGPTHAPVPSNMVDWFAEGADALATLFAERDPADPVWTWSREQTAGFWARMQSIEAAVHRWDAQGAVGEPRPIDPELAADAVVQTFQVMAPARRAWTSAPPGAGERFRFRRTDGPGDWTVTFDGATVAVTDGPGAVEIAGTASDLALFVWRRLPADRLDVTGDAALLDRYFTLVPPT
jgi:uncharacterized protein (TIGR03083 family)